jgi:acetaldehyde dehydrogenase (acetylating)
MNIVVLCPLVDSDSSGPAIVPNTNHLEHLTAVKFELVTCPGRVCPQGSHLVTGVNLILGIVVTEV